MDRRRERLYRLALSWCSDAMLADDLVQDALSNALRKKDQLRDLAKLDPWVFRILHNCWAQYLRRNRPTTDLDAIQLVDHNSPDLDADRQQVIDNVRHSVSQLPMGQRQVVTLVDLEEFKYSEVAEILDIPVGTVMSRLSRARKTLKDNLLDMNCLSADKQPKLRSVK